MLAIIIDEHKGLVGDLLTLAIVFLCDFFLDAEIGNGIGVFGVVLELIPAIDIELVC